MTLKRSLSQKFKSTLEKTKRIVSSSSLSSFDNHSPSVSDSFSFNSTDFSTPLTSTSTTFNDATDFGGLGIQYNKDSISLNRKSSSLDPPTLLYSRKKRSGTMSRSIPNRKQSIDLIDTSTPTNITSSIPTPESQDDLLNSQSQDRPSILIPSNYSSTTTSYTLNSFAENSAKCNMDLLESHEIIQDDVDSIFTKSNQIDHLDKDLDTRKNDLLADQMALNILQNIDEEDVDELSKLKEEISMI
ncbi:hypothetical protein BOH78_2005 [Pichia kudriavzevii]|uniref:Uncharacterized protein n=1 Tax=Pichia kudriavzevii TaxID=4909 RepID=A0A1V2LNX3_PICKU|nr:hypothetical protein BOH78_5282 [Pichia kudriavzevii]ONH75136.1 hypothetical protein BOH78_2005 [Pichia kudriavzevii]